jgi:hypothetical protein
LRFTLETALPRRQSDPRAHLATIFEVMSGTQASKQCARRCWADAAQLQEPATALVIARNLANRVVFDQSVLDVAGVLKQIANAAFGPGKASRGTAISRSRRSRTSHLQVHVPIVLSA